MLIINLKIILNLILLFFSVGYVNDDILLFGGNENLKEKNDNYLLKNGDTLEEFNNNENVVVFLEKNCLDLLEVDIVL